MVERARTRSWTSLYEPIKKVSQKIADWFAPRSDAAVLSDAYDMDRSAGWHAGGDRREAVRAESRRKKLTFLRARVWRLPARVSHPPTLTRIPSTRSSRTAY